MSSLLAIPLALVLTACGTSGSVDRRAQAPAPEVVTVPAPPRTPPSPETFPLDGAFVYQPDPRCTQHGVGLVLPDLGRAVCMRGKALEYLIAEVSAKRVRPGSGFTQCDWAWTSDTSWAGCVEAAIRATTPELRFGQSAFWTRGSIGLTEQEGCAAGVAYHRYVRVSIHDLPRSYSLVSWETLNSLVRWLFDRGDLGDGPVVAAGTRYAEAECPAN